MRKSIYYFVSALLLISCSNDVEEWNPGDGGGQTPPPATAEDAVWHERAKEVFDLINQYYRIPSGTWAGLYNENYPKGSENSSYLWPYDGFVSGAAALYELGYDIDYTTLVDQFSSWWTDSGAKPVGGYASQFLTHSVDIRESRQDCHPISIGDYCFIGTGVKILGGSVLPARSVLGAGAVLNKRYEKEWTVYAGVPARPVKEIDETAKYFHRESGFIY